jgi:hypothetical protein
MRFLWFLPVGLLLSCTASPTAQPEIPAPLDEPATSNKISLAAPLPSTELLQQLAQSDPVTFLEMCLRRYEQEVRGYRARFIKQERIQGVLGPVEHIDVWFGEQPFRVRMDWKKGFRLASRLLYVQGQNNDQLLVRPHGLRGWLVDIAERPVHHPDALQSSRYPITDFGMANTTRKALRTWKEQSQQGDLNVRYGGIEKVPQLGGKPCWVLRRDGYPPSEPDGDTSLVFYFDTTTWLQTGTILKNARGELLASYFYTDVELNPELPSELFSRAGLKQR